MLCVCLLTGERSWPNDMPFLTFALLCHWEPCRAWAFILHMFIFIFFIFCPLAITSWLSSYLDNEKGSPSM